MTITRWFHQFAPKRSTVEDPATSFKYVHYFHSAIHIFQYSMSGINITYNNHLFI